MTFRNFHPREVFVSFPKGERPFEIGHNDALARQVACQTVYPRNRPSAFLCTNGTVGQIPLPYDGKGQMVLKGSYLQSEHLCHVSAMLVILLQGNMEFGLIGNSFTWLKNQRTNIFFVKTFLPTSFPQMPSFPLQRQSILCL